MQNDTDMDSLALFVSVTKCIFWVNGATKANIELALCFQK